MREELKQVSNLEMLNGMKGKKLLIYSKATAFTELQLLMFILDFTGRGSGIDLNIVKKKLDELAYYIKRFLGEGREVYVYFNNDIL